MGWIGDMNGGSGPKKGALHKKLGIPAGQKIPKAKLAKAAKAPGKEGKMGRLAETLEGFHKKGKDSKSKESMKKKESKKTHKKSSMKKGAGVGVKNVASPTKKGGGDGISFS